MIHECGKINCPAPYISYRVIKHAFERDYSYVFNLNPDPKKEQQLERLFKYLQKKKYTYWLAESISSSGYKHYHGMLRFNIIPEDIEKTKKAINKQINTYIGRSVPLVRPDSLKAWYRYIHGPTNSINQEFIFTTTIETPEMSDSSSSAGDGVGHPLCFSERKAQAGDDVDASHYD